MSYVLCPMSYVWGLWTQDFGLGAKGLGLGQDGLGLYGVGKVTDVFKPIHCIRGYNYGKQRLHHFFPSCFPITMMIRVESEGNLAVS